MSVISKAKTIIKKRGGLLPAFFHVTGIEKDWSDEYYLRYRYAAVFKRKLNLENPIRFSEKMQWLKLYDRKDEYTEMVDKYAVRKFVSNRIGEEYVIPVIGVWNSFEEINFSELPQRFVLKTTHDSGGIVICTDKNTFDIEQARKKITKSLSRNYYLTGREWNYKNVVPRIIAEEYLENDSKEGLHDYKVWCFNGKALYVQYITGRISEVTYEGFYDRDWQLQPFSYHNQRMLQPIPRPKRLEELLMLAEKLSEGLPFARVDFYILQDDSIKFGEITFVPMGGTETWKPDSMDIELGGLITLPQKS